MTTAKVKIDPETYLGDGLYCHDDLQMLRVWTTRNGIVHEVFLEPDTLQELVTFARQRGYVIK